MAAPRATQFIALRNLARHGSSSSAQQVRSLHMTGPATYASPVLTKERSILHLPRDIAGLRAECKRRKVEATGSMQDLISRLNADELAHSRAFSSLATATTRPTAASETTATNGPLVRHFNTSRRLKAVNDTSTIDFAYLPDETALYASSPSSNPAILRVPILPTSTATHNILSSPVPTEPSPDDIPAMMPMKPLINTLSGDARSQAAVQPLAGELSDCHGLHIDFHAVADQLVSSLDRGIKKPVQQQVSILRQIWGDMLEDVTGGGKVVAVK